MKCPSCNGTLYFDISKQNLKCRHCSQTFDIDEYERNNSAEEALLAEGRMYTCQNCGAQLISADDEAVTYCSYCGSEQILESELSGVKHPKYIIPFSVTKKYCKTIYQNELKNKLYVPSEFKDPEFIEKFRPFYIPYWMYRVKFREEPFDAKGYRDYTAGNYDYHEEYNLRLQVKDKGLYGIPYDASRNFDDSIAENIAPYKKDKMVLYKQGYLAGMYADSPNVDAETYQEEVLDKATAVATKDLEKDLGGIRIKLPKSKKKLQEFFETRYEGEDAIFLPVWFLTWRKGNRVAYAVVNGQTGKIHIDLPADMKMFTFYTLVGAAGLFALLSLFLTVTSRFVLWFSALLVYLTGIRYHNELRKIRDRENHVFDKGYLLNDEKELVMTEKKRSRLRRKLNAYRNNHVFMTILISFIVFFFSFGLVGMAYDLMVSQTGAIVMTFIILFLEFIRFFKQASVAVYLRNKRSLFACFLGLFAVIYAFMVASGEPVEDWWYYLGGLICLGASSIMCIDLILRYNETATRPLPSFYSRKGGNDRA